MNRASSALRKIRARRISGVALVFALISVLIIAVIALGVTTATTQHYALARAEVDQAAALDVAEAGVHFELNKMTLWERGAPVTIDNGANSPFFGIIAAFTPDEDLTDPNGGISRVYVATDADGVSPWTPPGRFVLVASGTVPQVGTTSGVVRRIQAFGRAVTVGDLYTCYGVNSFVLNGAGAAFNQGSPGYVGTSGTATFSAGAPTILNGTFVFDQRNGLSGGWSGTPPNVDWVSAPTESLMPTVDQIGARVVSREYNVGTFDPLGFFRTSNDNNQWIRARTPSGNLVDIIWKDKDGNDLPHNRISAALFEGNNPNAIVLFGNPALTQSGLKKGSDFYFESIEIPDGRTLEIQNGSEGGTIYGPVRLWFGPRGALPDANTKFNWTQGKLVVHWGDPSGQRDQGSFTVYNGSRVPINVGGNLNAGNAQTPQEPGVFAVLYAYNSDGFSGYGKIDFSFPTAATTPPLRGSAVAWDLVQSAGTLRAFPARADSPVDPFAYVIYYAVETPVNSTGWNEVGRLSAVPGSR